MIERFRTAFFAYPSDPPDLIATIQAAPKQLSGVKKLELRLWPEMNTHGLSVPDSVRDSIVTSDVTICDITKPNLNVYYEVGYAIGSGKPVAPVLNSSFSGASSEIQRDGIFDTVGYKIYENSNDLADILLSLPSEDLLSLYSRSLNHQQPLFLLNAFRKTDFMNAITSAIKSSKVFFRSFDPAEIPRFSSIAAIAEATASSGVVVPFLGTHIDDAPRHNLRAAFLAGLSHGLGRQTLLLGLSSGTSPTDYREDVRMVKHPSEIQELVEEFAQSSILAGQSLSGGKKKQRTGLQKIRLGASAAENEFRTLENYFVETSEYVRTLRGEVGIVAGRKGSGKTAIFFMARDTFREDKRCITIDLKPESHQLSLFRDQLLKLVDAGAFDHTLAAFWYFVVLSEILLAIKRDLEHKSKQNDRFLTSLVQVDRELSALHVDNTGDFTSRITALGRHVIDEIMSIKSKNEKLTPERLTNLIFRGAIGPIKTLIGENTSSNSHIVFLFDNIDKGWPANGVDVFDIRLVRLLIETLDKVGRDFGVQDRDFLSVVFLRNDIYELMVEDTPDRGKANQIRIDWTDKVKLRQVIYRRLQSSERNDTRSFDDIWGSYFISHVNGRSSFEYFVDHCLMRPRFLITIIENAIANAINRGHSLVDEDDCIDAVRQHSHYLVDDFGYEIRDASGITADILYSLVGSSRIQTKSEITARFRAFDVPDDQLDRAFQLMLWYGVVGLETDSGARYIYDYEYKLKRLEAAERNLGDGVLYAINPAIHVALAA